MFRTTKAFSSFSVDDLEEAKEFYGETLGLDVRETPEGLVLRIAGGTEVFVYHSTDYRAPDHTVLNFPVDDIDDAVAELRRRGVKMEHYDLPDIKTDAKGIFRGEMGPAAIAWFKDPAGHILSVLEERRSAVLRPAKRRPTERAGARTTRKATAPKRGTRRPARTAR
jgi:catechol 2,3-dioxygenase-like lactoylglutathione lyase family enzyme